MIPNLNPTALSIPEALSIKINQLVYNKKENGERVYTFSLGEAFFEIPRFDISDDEFMAGYHYSSSMGQIKLRTKIAKLYKNSYASDVDETTEVLISAGSKVIIAMLFQLILSTNDEVLVPEPAWLSYKELIKLAGGTYVPVPYYENIEGWQNYITKKTKAIVINNPNNPSGRLYSLEELEFLLFLAEKHDLFIISDEAYSDFLLDANKFTSFTKVDKVKEHCLVVNSLSKNMGMSGWRVGYAIAHKNVIKQLLKLNQHIVTCAPTVLQNYMADHFDEILSWTIPQARKAVEKRAAVQSMLDRIGIKALDGVGTFYLFLDVSSFKGTTEELVFDLLFNHNIATVFGSAYGESTKNFIRFGIGIENLNDIEKCLNKIKIFLDMKTYDNTKIYNQMKKENIILP